MTTADIINIVIAIATVFSVLYLSRQLSDTRKQMKAQFLLELDNQLSLHDVASKELFSNTQLEVGKDTKISDHEIWRYMGFFERINLMFEDKILDISTIYQFYGYRIYRIIGNDSLFKMLEDDPESWQNFISLCKAIGIYRQTKGADQIDEDFIEKVNKLRVIRLKPNRIKPIFDSLNKILEDDNADATR